MNLKQLSNTFGEDYFTGKTSNYMGYPSALIAPVHMERLQAIIGQNPQSVLDVGAANGIIVDALRHAGIPALGAEVSEYLLQTAPPRLQAQVVWASADHLPFADKQFDLVTSGDLLEHIPEADVPAVIAELKRVGKRQFHDIYCGANPDDRDATHITIHPISWWQNLFGKEAILRETKP